MKTVFTFLFTTLLSFSAYAQFGDLMKGLEKLVKDIESGTQQQSQPQQQQSQSSNKRQELIDLMFSNGASLYIAKYQDKLFRPQMEFNVKYGGPPVSANYKKIISTDIPNLMKQFSDCSIKAGGPKVDDDSILSWSQTSKSDGAKTLREFLSIMKMVLGGQTTIPVKVPETRKDLNLAPNTENETRLMLELFNYAKSFAKSEKNWCDDMIKEIK